MSQVGRGPEPCLHLSPDPFQDTATALRVRQITSSHPYPQFLSADVTDLGEDAARDPHVFSCLNENNKNVRIRQIGTAQLCCVKLEMRLK